MTYNKAVKIFRKDKPNTSKEGKYDIFEQIGPIPKEYTEDYLKSKGWKEFDTSKQECKCAEELEDCLNCANGDHNEHCKQVENSKCTCKCHEAKKHLLIEPSSVHCYHCKPKQSCTICQKVHENKHIDVKKMEKLVDKIKQSWSEHECPYVNMCNKMNDMILDLKQQLLQQEVKTINMMSKGHNKIMKDTFKRHKKELLIAREEEVKYWSKAMEKGIRLARKELIEEIKGMKKKFVDDNENYGENIEAAYNEAIDDVIDSLKS